MIVAPPAGLPHTNGVPDDTCLIAEEVTKFYGEVLGVNRVSLRLPPGITSLVGPNGSGKTTLMSLFAGLLRPTSGSVRVLGLTSADPEALYDALGYCTQVDAFPPGATGREFVAMYLELAGRDRAAVAESTERALTRLGMAEVADRKVAGYSKGMRQRIKLAQAVAHEPPVLFLDEPLNGLDPLARAEVIDLFRQLAHHGMHLVISSHILHEVDLLSDRVVILDHGYVVADGGIHEVRSQIDARPLQMQVRCDRPVDFARAVLGEDHVTEIRLDDDGRGLVVGTRDAGRFYDLLQRVVVEEEIVVEQASPADEDAQALYRYLVTGREDQA